MSYKTIKYWFLFIFATVTAAAQAPLGEMRSFEIIPGGDTLRIDRKNGTWWYGVHGGFQLNNYFGSLYVPSSNQVNNPFNFFTKYNSGSGAGYFVGGLFEWKPPGEKFTGQLAVNFFDHREINGSVIPYLDTSFNIKSKMSVVTIHPTVKYHLPVEGLNLSAGVIVDMQLKNEGFQNIQFVNTGKVVQEINTEFTEPVVGFGLSFGVSYDILIADYRNRSRLLISPFAEINLRSPVVSSNQSAFYATTARFGFALKFGNDDVIIDTLFYDPTFELPPQYFAAIKKPQVVFTADADFEVLPSAYIAYVEQSKVSGEIAEVKPQERDTSFTIAAELPRARKTETKKEEPVVAKAKDIEIKKGIAEKLTYPTSPAVRTTNEIRTYLDKVVEYLKAHPTARVIVIGHSDTRGTIEQNTTRSRERAKDVEKYLLSKGVPLGRIIASFQGSLYSVAPNDTEEGRRQNRRVEITIED